MSVANQRRERRLMKVKAWISIKDTFMALCQTHSHSWGMWQCNTTAVCDSPHGNTQVIFTAKCVCLCVCVWLVRSTWLCHQSVFRTLIFHSTFCHLHIQISPSQMCTKVTVVPGLKRPKSPIHPRSEVSLIHPNNRKSFQSWNSMNPAANRLLFSRVKGGRAAESRP